MISEDIAQQVLNIGCKYNNPKGGVAQVLKSYELSIYPIFKHVTNSGEGSRIYKLYKAISALIIMTLKLIFDKRIKIVHIHTASYNSFKRSSWFVRLAKIFRKKAILHIHGGGFKEYYTSNKEYVTNILNKCDCIITLSKSWKIYFEQITNCKQIEIVENIIESPSVLTTLKDPTKIHFLFLGLITEEKGIFDLLEVISANKREWKDKLCLHVGGNGKINELNHIINNNELKDMVIFEGWVSGDRKIQLLNIADAYILPSYTEGVPISILESMSYGLPILSTPVGGIPEIVDNTNGILFTPGDKKELSLAIETILQSPLLRKEMGEKSKIKSQPHLPENIGHKLEKIYSQMLKLEKQTI